MTTILGIKAEGIIWIFADSQVSNEEDENKKKTLEGFTKLRRGKNYAAAFAGDVEKKLNSVFAYLKSRNLPAFLKKNFGKDADNLAKLLQIDPNMDPILQSIESSWFYPLGLFNICRDRSYEMEGAPEFVLATNTPSLELYRVTSWGNLVTPKDQNEDEDIEFIVIGSGSKEVKTYFSNLEYERDTRNIPEIIRIGNQEITRKQIKTLDTMPPEVAYHLGVGGVRSTSDKDTGGVVYIAGVSPDKVFTMEDVVEEIINRKVREGYNEILSNFHDELKWNK